MGKQWKRWQTVFFRLQNHCRWWPQPWNWKMLASWKKSYDQPRQNIKKRDTTLLTKAHLVKTMVFPVVMYGCESWSIKKAERWRIDALEQWCWRRLLRVPWTARRSILKEISPEYSLEELMLKLKLQYSGHLMHTNDSLEKSLMQGKIDGKRRRGHQMMRWLESITDAMNMNWASSGRRWGIGSPGMLQSVRLQRVRCDWATEQ